MEKTEETITARLAALQTALMTLSEALEQPFNSFIRDSAIKRYEWTFELSWKLMKSVLRFHGISCDSPRQCIREAYSIGIISDIEIWFEALANRNQSSHIYNEHIADEIFKYVNKFPQIVSDLIKNVQTESFDK